MFKAFNSLQITALFAGFPFGISWLFNSATFPGASIAAWISIVAYLVFFGMMTAAVYTSVEEWD
jgi:hypothetical protein